MTNDKSLHKVFKSFNR